MSTGKDQLEISGAATEDAELAEGWMTVGAVNAVDSIAQSLASQTIRNLQRIRDQKLYRKLGFNRFEEFLDSPRSRINYAKFNRLEKAIEREGDELFDYLEAIDAPLSKRKLLGKGDVRVEGKEIVATLDGDDEEIRVPLNNQGRILNVLSRVVEQRNEQARKIRRGEKEVKNLKEKITKLRSSNGHGGSGNGGFFDALLNLGGSFSLLATEAEKLPEDQRKTQREKVFEAVGEHLKRVDQAFGFERPAKSVRVAKHLVDDEG